MARGVLSAWRISPNIDFIVAFFHECAFSTCNGHSSDGGVRSALGGLFARYQVEQGRELDRVVFSRVAGGVA